MSSEYRNPFQEILSGIPDEDDRPGITLTRGQLEAWVGFTLTDEQVEQLDEAIPNSSIPEAISTIAIEALGLTEEDPPTCPNCNEELVGEDPKYCPICDKEEEQ
jgi:hypothetical protein